MFSHCDMRPSPCALLAQGGFFGAFGLDRLTETLKIENSSQIGALVMRCDVLEFPAAKPAINGPALADWLKSQSCVVDIWIERLVAEGGDVQLIALLDQHAAFLREAQERSDLKVL